MPDAFVHRIYTEVGHLWGSELLIGFLRENKGVDPACIASLTMEVLMGMPELRDGEMLTVNVPPIMIREGLPSDLRGLLMRPGMVVEVTEDDFAPKTFSTVGELIDLGMKMALDDVSESTHDLELVEGLLRAYTGEVITKIDTRVPGTRGSIDLARRLVEWGAERVVLEAVEDGDQFEQMQQGLALMGIGQNILWQGYWFEKPQLIPASLSRTVACVLLEYDLVSEAISVGI